MSSHDEDIGEKRDKKRGFTNRSLALEPLCA